MYQSLKGSLRRFAAAIQFAHSKDVINKAKADKEVMGLVGPLVEELENRLSVQERYLMQTRASVYTRSINRTDRMLYGRFRTFVLGVKTCMLLTEEDKLEAANTLKGLLAVAGITSKMKFQRRLAKMTLFVEELTTTYRTEVELLGLDSEAKELMSLVDSLNNDVLNRIEERMQIPVGAHATARREAEVSYARLIAALNGLKIVDTEGKLSELMDFIRAERARIDLSEAGRRRHSADDPAREQTAETESVSTLQTANEESSLPLFSPAESKHDHTDNKENIGKNCCSPLSLPADTSNERGESHLTDTGPRGNGQRRRRNKRKHNRR